MKAGVVNTYTVSVGCWVLEDLLIGVDMQAVTLESKS